MKRRILIVAMLLALVSTAQGQGHGRPWRRGPLQLEEFGVTAPAGGERSHLDYGIVYTTSGTTEGINTYLYCRTTAVMYPTASWIADGNADEAELNYNQALFDLVEVHRRQMQREAILLSKKVQYNKLLEATMDNLDREMQMVQAATESGRDSLAVERIRVKNREWLNTHPGSHPEFSPRAYWWCLGIEAGAMFNTGEINDLITPSIGSMGYMGGIGWGRHGFYFSVRSASSLARDSSFDYNGQLVLPAMYRTDVNLFSYGFTLFDRPQFSITPYLAIGFTDIESVWDWYFGASYTFGVMGRYHLHHWHFIKDGAKGKARRFTPSVTANLYGSYTNLEWEGKGVTVGLQVGLSIGMRREKVTWMKDEQ